MNHVASTEDALKHWDSRRKSDLGHGIPWHNIGQHVSRTFALFRALQWMRGNGLAKTPQVLDVGASNGYGLRPFLLEDFKLSQLHGMDLFQNRVDDAKEFTPGIDIICGDATQMPYCDDSFDIVCEQFCFCHIPDDEAKKRIASEMMRVSRQFILVHDWRMGSERKKLYGVTRARLREWFPGWRVVKTFRSQLWPVIGRPISSYAPFLYDVARLFGPLVGSRISILYKSRY